MALPPVRNPRRLSSNFAVGTGGKGPSFFFFGSFWKACGGSETRRGTAGPSLPGSVLELAAGALSPLPLGLNDAPGGSCGLDLLR